MMDFHYTICIKNDQVRSGSSAPTPQAALYLAACCVHPPLHFVSLDVCCVRPTMCSMGIPAGLELRQETLCCVESSGSDVRSLPCAHAGTEGTRLPVDGACKTLSLPAQVLPAPHIRGGIWTVRQEGSRKRGLVKKACAQRWAERIFPDSFCELSLHWQQEQSRFILEWLGVTEHGTSHIVSILLICTFMRLLAPFVAKL